MFAAFLKDADGNMDIAGIAISLVGLLMALGTLFWLLPRAVRMGRIPFGAGGVYGGSTMVFVERSTHPVRFWFLFILYSLLIPVGVAIIILAAFGLGRKSI